MKIGNLKVYGVVYKITNLANGKVYIGQTIKKNGFKGRYKAKGNGIERVYGYHKSRKERGDFYNVHLFNSINKYGFSNFKVEEVFDVAFSKSELDIKEKSYIELYKSYNKDFGYNNNFGGANGKVTDEALINMTKKKIICLNDGMIFKSCKEIRDFYNIKITNDNITNCCRGSSNSCSEYNGERLVFKYYDYYKTLSKEDITNFITKAQLKKGKDSPYAKKIICLNTGEVFNCLQDASNWCNVSKTCICEQLKGRQKTAGKHPTTKEKLKWDYYKE